MLPQLKQSSSRLQPGAFESCPRPVVLGFRIQDSRFRVRMSGVQEAYQISFAGILCRELAALVGSHVDV